MTHNETIIRDYNNLIERTIDLIEDYGHKFWKTRSIDPFDIEFDLEDRTISFGWYHHQDTEYRTIPLDCLLDRDNWETIAQNAIDEEYRKEREHKEKLRKERERQLKLAQEEAERAFYKEAERLGYTLVKNTSS